VAPPIVHTIAALRRALAPLRADGVALVPTMGALHDGHLSLIRLAQTKTPHVVTSIFVNPTQFAPHEDFAAYPRTLENDAQKLEGVKASLIFAPSAAEMYGTDFATTVSVAGPALGLESDFRPHFFAGVATIVAKLLIAAAPDFAVFGEKDYQQLLVVRRLVADLNLGTEIIAAPTAREADGLALSSRNAYLAPAERQIAGRLNGILKQAIAQLHNGEARAEVEREAVHALKAAGFTTIDYVAVRDAHSLEPAEDAAKPRRILAAARIGGTRLIDNMAV
jgi:pantoate--beta-alanine ligase